MIIVTTENVPNYKTVEVKGPVFGLTVRARGIGNEDSKNFKLHDRGGKNWLSIDGYKDNFGNIDRNLFQVEEA
ncbi:hypothetical protein AZK53_08750 [Priestia megaterium]|jgi:hypothetical protein|nr:hypothetical protein AZK53_08750 [Priestia megaterium]